MKKFNLFLGLSALSLALLFSSCESTDEDPVGPTVTFKAGTDLITEDATINAGTVASFSWEAVKGDAKLAEFTIRIGNQDVEGFPTTDIDKDEYQATFDTTLTEAGDHTFAFIVTDKDGMSATEEIKVTVESALVIQGTASLGAGGNALGSYYSIANSAVYTQADAITNKDVLDIVFTSTDAVATFKSPKDALNAEISGANRTTLFAIATFSYDDATATDVGNMSLSADNVDVSQGDVVVFETEEETRGVFLVDALTVNASGATTIKIKVKQ